MNFVGHVLVAGRVAPGAPTAHLVGAAAPDLVRMARLPVASRGPTAFVEGVAAHHRTDTAFHDSPWFRERNRRLVAELTAGGVRRGPARGAAHVLIELLLDGALLAHEEHAATFAPVWTALAEAAPDALVAVDAEHEEPWRDFLGRLTTQLDPHAYADPAYAAARTAATLARRPRLALSEVETSILTARAPGTAASVEPAAALGHVLTAMN